MKADEYREEDGVLAASLNNHAQIVARLWFPKNRLQANLCFLIKTFHRSELIQVQLKVRRKRKRKEKIPQELQENLQKLDFLACADDNEGFQG